MLNILINSVRMVRKFVVRDFYEIEKIQDSLKNNETFIKKSYNKLNLEVVELLQKIKPNFKIYNKLYTLLSQIKHKKIEIENLYSLSLCVITACEIGIRVF